MSLMSHTKYKTTGVEWIGDIPDHWIITRFKQIFRERNERSTSGEEELLSVSAYTGISPRSEIIDSGDHLSRADTLVGYKVCYANDLVMNIMLAWNRGLGFSKQDGIVSPAYSVFELVANCSPSFLDYLVRSNEYTGYFKCHSSGVIDSRLRLYPDYFGRLICAIPPIAEQRSIAAFLDHETAKIDALVEEQRRLIELLKEKRQAVISHAVTKGLNPNAPMKDSGIEWLGEVPEHWTVCSARRLFSKIEQGWSPDCHSRPAEEGEWAVVKSGCANRGTFNENENKALPDTLSPIPELEIKVGDVIMSRASGSPELVGSVAFVDKVRAKLMLSDKVFRFNFHDAVEPEFFVAIFNSQFLRRQIEQSISGAQGLANNLPQSSLKDFVCTLPPKKEQLQIIAMLRSKTDRLNQLINAADAAIALLQERRAALISAAITGKIDIRQSAKIITLPVAEARGLVAAEIIERMSHRKTFGRVKFQKAVYLAEVHANISEIKGRYSREAAGPYDNQLINEMEGEVTTRFGFRVDGPAQGTSPTVYHSPKHKGRHKDDLSLMLGSAREKKLNEIISKLNDLDTRGTEAIATLYAVWNDALIDGEIPNDDRIVHGVLTEWHVEKQAKFHDEELHTWLGWMRRNGLVPEGRAPRTLLNRLFA